MFLRIILDSIMVNYDLFYIADHQEMTILPFPLVPNFCDNFLSCAGLGKIQMFLNKARASLPRVELQRPAIEVYKQIC